VRPRFQPFYDVDSALKAIEIATARHEAAVQAEQLLQRYLAKRREAPIPGNWLLGAVVVALLCVAGLAYVIGWQ
jgi:hypothetical protein